MQRQSFGPDAWWLDDVDDPVGLRASILESRIAGVLDVIASHRSLFVECLPQRHAGIGDRLDTISPSPAGARFRRVTLDIAYDEAGLEAIAAASGLGPDHLKFRLGSTSFRVAMLGDRPGTSLLTGLDDELSTASRVASTQRTQVGGSIAMRNGLLGVAPGGFDAGWWLIGHSNLPVWSPASIESSQFELGVAVELKAS